jgi:hypothetical protein
MIKKQQEEFFPRSRRIVIKEPFTPAFMRALETEAEREGNLVEAQNIALTQANKYIDENRRTENHQLDEIYQKGGQAGYERGLEVGEPYYSNKGYLGGFIAGLDRGETYKAPFELYDTEPKFDSEGKLKSPLLASARSAHELASKVANTPELAVRENNLWASKAPDKPERKGHTLKSWMKTDQPGIAYLEHPEMNRLSLNLNEFSGNRGAFLSHVQGLEGYKESNTKVLKSRKLEVPVERETVLARAMGRNLKAPLHFVDELPPRPEPTIPRYHPQVEVMEDTPIKKPKKPIKSILAPPPEEKPKETIVPPPITPPPEPQLRPETSKLLEATPEKPKKTRTPPSTPRKTSVPNRRRAKSNGTPVLPKTIHLKIDK